MQYFTMILLVIGLLGCYRQSPESVREQSMKEIAKAEADFAALALEKGMTVAFGTFAAPEAKIKFRDTILNGREDIIRFYTGYKYRDGILRWKPDFIDAAMSGEMGYTYGRYTFSATDSSGKPIFDKGYFHTVWKKQADGSWRFVWD